jgi:hypothetical protein
MCFVRRCFRINKSDNYLKLVSVSTGIDLFLKFIGHPSHLPFKNGKRFCGKRTGILNLYLSKPPHILKKVKHFCGKINRYYALLPHFSDYAEKLV